MRLPQFLVVGVCAVAAIAANGTPAFAAGGGQARSPRAAPARVVGGVPRGVGARPIAPLASRTVHLYGPRRLGFDIHAGWATGYSRFGPYRNDPFGYGYGYGYGYPVAGYQMLPAFGSVRISDAPRDAEVYVDGYYAGVVDDFDGRFQRLNLEPGPYQIELRAAGVPSQTFDVNVQPGRTITYRATPRP